MPRQITIDDREVIEIVNSQGAVTGSFLFNPADLDIVKRCEKVVDFFDHFKLPEADSAENMDAIDTASKQVKEQFDYLLDSEASKTLFAHCNPFSPREDGTLYCEYVLDTIVKFIESELNTRSEKLKNRVNKYTRKYAK